MTCEKIGSFLSLKTGSRAEPLIAFLSCGYECGACLPGRVITPEGKRVITQLLSCVITHQAVRVITQPHRGRVITQTLLAYQSATKSKSPHGVALRVYLRSFREKK